MAFFEGNSAPSSSAPNFRHLLRFPSMYVNKQPRGLEEKKVINFFFGGGIAHKTVSVFFGILKLA